MTTTSGLRVLIVLALLGAVFASVGIFGAPAAHATSVADLIICDTFTTLNDMGEPIPNLDHEPCPGDAPPPPPTCNEGEHLDGTVCVPDEQGGETGEEEDDNTPPADTNPSTDTPNPGGGSGAPTYTPLTSGATPAVETTASASSTEPVGEVLGESCGIYMNAYLRMGNSRNDAEQVKKLQEFLNKTVQAELPVTGYFGLLTHNAVKRFQSAHAATILTPWGIGEPTGLVYLTTAYEINRIECPSATLALPALVPWSENPAI